MSQRAFIFDVDGTLTSSRQSITDEMREAFIQFAQNNDVYLVSGSDYSKSVEQLGQDIVDNVVKRSYNCSGNSVWENGVEIYRSDWSLPVAARNYLMSVLSDSQWKQRTGNHLEVRTGAVNFSIVGRNASHKQRTEYIEFDTATGEREKIAKRFNMLFGGKHSCTAHIGGQISLDITKTGKDKQQILDDFENRDIVFFGDKCEPGGNDYTLAQAILNRGRDGDQIHNVRDWQDTLHILTNLY